MITPCEMYWIVKLDDIRSLVCCLGIPLFAISVVFISIGLGGWLTTPDDELDKPKFKRGAKILCTVVSIGVMLLTIHAFLPSTKELAAIKVIPALANNEKIQDVGNSLYELAASWLEELKPNKTPTALSETKNAD